VTVLGATGHQQIPPQALPHIDEALSSVLASYGAPTGVCSLAAGADQLFARTIIAHRGKLQAVIPCRGYEASFADESDRQGYRILLEEATRVIELDFPAPSEEAYFTAGRTVVDTCEHLIAIWDGQPSRGLGGTADIVSYAREANRPLTVIWPAGIRRA
jgi:hypothetical protein